MTIDLETQQDRDVSAALLDNIEIVTAGQMLRDARTALSISVRQVSDNINLKMSVIDNIEQDISDKNISQTFMRGYIRCYARYLKISETEVLSAYGCQNMACEQQAELQSFSRRTKLEASDNRLMLVSYGILGFMLIVFLIWGFQRNEVAVVVPEHEIGEVVPEIPAVSPLVTSPSTAVTVPAKDAVPSQVIAEPAVSTPQSQSNPVTNTAEQTIAKTLALTFSGDCWVQIKDKYGKTLAIGVKNAGQVLTLQGEAPLTIKLGAPEQVRMDYAGDNIDLSAFRKGRVAKFKLPFEA
ncbi:MAG: cytoskeleton protein RodZ [Moritella sp.]|jgi:cytoskeleton protein RodZ